MAQIIYSDTIEGYEVHNLLGQGGFARVYRAIERSLGFAVAIKMIDKKKIKADGMEQRVQQEVGIHRRLKHPSILKLYTCFQDVNYVYLVLELCDNGTLQQYFKKIGQVLLESEASYFLRQVVKGVDYLHSNKILHRDISLSNLLLTTDLHIKIADFGLATELSTLDEKHHTMCGTLNFIAPEVVSRSSHGFEADIWSLGCLLYTLLCGKPPFDTQAVLSTLAQVVTADLDLPENLSPEASDLITALLQKNPEHRIKLNEVLEHPFIKGPLFCNNMMSKMTQDSGVHTMSSRWDSALSDGVLNMVTSNANKFPRYPKTFSNHHKSEQELIFPQRRSTSKIDNRTQKCTYYSDPGGGGACKDNTDTCLGSRRNTKFHGLHSPHKYYYPTTNISENKKCLQEHSSRNVSYNNQHKHTESCYSLCNMPKIQSHHKPPDTRELKGVVPITSNRLRPIRHQTKDAILSILENGDVCVEILRKRGPKQLVFEVCLISPDGIRIVVYEPEGGKGVNPSSKPPPLPAEGTDQIFNSENLPEKHRKKYKYASKFINLLKAGTPKVTYYTEKAKCFLMENLTDFEACFYKGGKVTQSATDGITIIDSTGQRVHFDSVNAYGSTLSGSMELLWSHAQHSRNHCLDVERCIAQLRGNCNFPVVIGQKPSIAPSGKENRPYSAMPSFSGSANSTAVTSTSIPRSKKCQVTTPGIGTETKHLNGGIRVPFSDGTQLWLDGRQRIHYQQSDGQVVSYEQGTDHIPIQIVDKIKHIPKIIEHHKDKEVVHRKNSIR